MKIRIIKHLADKELSPDIVFIPGQVLARTRPTFYDLLIALAAGSAGGGFDFHGLWRFARFRPPVFGGVYQEQTVVVCASGSGHIDSIVLLQ
jgi:hypothetical protein